MDALKYALEQIALGRSIFPLYGVNGENECLCGKKACGDVGKHPATKNGLKDATNDPKKFLEMWAAAPQPSNYGIATGKLSNLTVIDVDVGQGKVGAESWAALIADAGEPNTTMIKTGGGGLHVLFKYNSALKTGSNRLGKGIDVRNDGGYIVGIGSKHRSGNYYEMLNDVPADDLPEYLLEAKTENRGRKRNDDPTRKKYTLEQATEMLKHITPDDRDTWRHVGIILGREFSRSDEAWEAYVSWSETWSGKKSRNHDEIMREAFYDISQEQSNGKNLSIGTLIKLAVNGGWVPEVGVVPIDNFIYFAPGNNFVYRPTASMWIATAVDVAVGKINDNGNIVKASDWISQNRLATSMTKSPALAGDYIKGFDCREGELIVQAGSALFNSYRKSAIELGDPKQAKPLLEHVNKVFNKTGDTEQFLDYMAHRVQIPEEKPRFALLIAGEQGCGKDTSIEFCVPAIGAWNVANIEPTALDSGFNEFSAATLVRVSEAANLHDMTKWAFNERMKVLIAGGPDQCTINPKYGQKYSVKMHCGVILTTNHLLSGIYIPADDRRYDVIECATKQEMGLKSDDEVRAYFSELWAWFSNGGAEHVAAFLHQRDISKFSASNGQRKTDAHRSVVSAALAADHWIIDALDELNEPDLARVDAIMTVILRNGGNEKES